MDPSADFLSWLAQTQPYLYGAFLVLAFLHRKLSVMVGQRNRPVKGEPFYRLWLFAGRISGAAWLDAPVSVKTILGPMPAGVLAADAVPKAADESPTKPERGTATPEGGWRSGDTPPQGSSGSYARIDPPKVPPAGVLIISFLFAFGSGCALSAIDKAKMEYSRALKAQTQIQSRYKLQQKEHQRKNIEKIGAHSPAAAQWQSEWIVKKGPVEEQIRRCQSILDEGSDYLLLSDDVRGIAAAKNATACVSAMKVMIGKLFDGGL